MNLRYGTFSGPSECLSLPWHPGDQLNTPYKPPIHLTTDVDYVN